MKENVLVGDAVDLFRFPAPKWHEKDGGRYIGTGCLVITRDPDEGWVNLGTYRVQLHDRTTLGILIAEGHHGDIMRRKYWSRGVACPTVVVCGQEPSLLAAGQFEVPWGTSEYDYAGGLRGEPVPVTRGVTTDLPIPATAEVAIEGEMLPPEVETRVEGPFGEYTGYYAGGAGKRPIIKATAILHRNNPILLGCPPSPNPAAFTVGKHIQVCAHLWNELDKQVPGVKGVWNVEDGTLRGIMVVSIQQMYGGHAKQVGMLTAASGAVMRTNRFVIVVDEDIDPSRMNEVLWALGTRVEPDKSIDIVSGCWGGIANPTLPPEQARLGDQTRSTAIIYACKPYYWSKQFPQSVKTSPEFLRKTKEKWAAHFR